MSGDSFPASLWSALTPPAAPAPALAGDHEADVVVVGAGFLGLSTALHLAEAGARVALVEGDEPGFGASGRNTGFVVPSLKTHLGPGDVGGLIGKDFGDRLVDLVGRSGDITFDLVARLGIDCAAERTGWLQPAHTPAILETLRKRQAEWRARGREVAILPAEETARAVGTAGYHGALFDPTGGQLNPLAYARGLARAATAAGVDLFAGSPVEAIEPDGTGWRARTARGSVRAGRILLTTNALVRALRPDVFGAIIPVEVHQVATQPLPAEVRATILPGRSPAADTRRHTFAVRWSPDGRLVTGGITPPGPGRRARAARFFARRLQRFFPGAGPLRAEFVWSGVIAVTTDSLPRYMTLAPGLDAVIGCNGRGIALTTALGREVASLLAGRVAPADFAIPHGPPRPVAGRRLAPYAPAFWLPWSALRDRIEAGR